MTSPIVLKFGSSVLRSRADLPAAVHEIYRWYRAGQQVVAVVSALDETTESLLAQAREFAPDPEPYATAELLATGERHSAALLGIALDRAGIPARVIDPRDIRLTVLGDVLDSEPAAADRERLRALLTEAPIIVVPGFFGYDTGGRLHLLGRGGSDLTAAYLATALRASRCRLVKDVDGVYESDPAIATATAPRRLSALSYADAIERAAPLVQPKAVRFLERYSMAAEVAAIGSPYESKIGPWGCALAAPEKPAPTSVLFLGLGTVGFGVYQRLAAMPEHFRIAGALVRNREKYEARGIPLELLWTIDCDLGRVNVDVVVDALPGLEPSRALTHAFLNRGISVVTANKAVIAERGPSLSLLASDRGACVRYSAAVGGSAPMIEAIRREVQRGEIRSIAGVLNGTCNYVLDRCAADVTFESAVQEARQRGFAESDCSEDLSGRDAARKLTILARHAFGQDVHAVEVEPLSACALEPIQRARRDGDTLRMVAMAWKGERRVFGQVRLDCVEASHPFARTRGEWNTLLITRTDGTTVSVTGRGAGRWPTTEAVMADLFELRRDRATTASPAHASAHEAPVTRGASTR